MKLCRVGKVGGEKPVIIDNENNYRDISSVIKVLDRTTLNFETLERFALSVSSPKELLSFCLFGF